ncbi:MAG: hypothetical protein IKN65_01225 [Clostridia bacterium]|nr:hypothetical protein [Clostridia bacterium]
MSKISRNKIFLVGVFLTLVMFISGIYAFTNLSILSIKNEINTGAVKIELQEYTVSNGTETLYDESDSEKVMPGQVISLIPRVSNIGDPCYIRAKVSYSKEDSELVNVDRIDNVSDDWIKKGEYWYYKPILQSGKKIDIFKTFTIPTDMPNDYQGKEIQVNITAEAIQADSFKPDFDSESPWNKVKVQKASDDVYKFDKVQMNTNAKIEYENNAQQYIEVPENFLGKLGHLVPGEVVEQDINLNNSTSKEIEYFVTVKKESGLSDKQLNLLKNLKLSISVDNKVVYEGNLYDIDKISLGKYLSKQSDKAKFTVKMPEELGNEYSVLNTSINWLFSVDGKDPVIPKKDPEVVPSPQTGDTKIQIALTVFLISAIGLIIVLIVERRVRKRN